MSESMPVTAEQAPAFMGRVRMLVLEDSIWHRGPRFWGMRIGLAGQDLEDVLTAYSEAFE